MNKLLTLVAFLLLAGTAHADNDKGFYAGAGLGLFHVKIDNVSDVAATLGEFDSDDVSFKAFAGWRFSKFISAEVDYLNLGKPEDDVAGVPVATELSGVSPYIVGTLPLGPIELSAKVGYLFYDFKLSAGPSGKREASREDPVYGVGIGLTLFGHLATQLEYEYIDISELEDSDALWLTAAWRF